MLKESRDFEKKKNAVAFFLFSKKMHDQSNSKLSLCSKFQLMYAFFFKTGYGDYFPTSPWGRVLGAATMMLGVIGLAMPISAINQVFHEVMEEHNKKKRTYIDATIEDRLQRVHKVTSCAHNDFGNQF